MMNDVTESRSRMVYTPEHHIPIGEAVKTMNGEYALRIKKPKGREVEVIPIGLLMAKIAQTAERK